MSIILLIVATLMPAAISFGILMLQKKTKFNKMPYMLSQTIIGVIFGLFAVGCTEFGIDIGGAILNVRDSAPICAGLIFGGPAGIIAGLIGGIERWFCVLWGGGQVTRLACSMATIIAGFNAALLRKIMFANKRPTVGFALGIGLGTEIMHMLLVLLTNIENMSYAFTFVQKCTIPMTLCNAIAVGLALVAVERKIIDRAKPKTLVKSFSSALFICVVILFFVTSGLTYIVHTNIANSESENLLKNNLTDVVDEIKKSGINQSIGYKRIGQAGGVIVTDKNGNVAVASRSGKPINLDKDNIEKHPDIRENTFYKVSINAEAVYCEFTELKDCYVFAYMPVAEADLSRNVTLYTTIFVEILIFVSVFCLVYQLTRIKMIEKIQEVNNGLERITDGKLDTKIEVRTSREFSSLSDDINQTVDALKDHIADAQKRIERELELAKQIQQSAVPFIFPPFPKRKDFDIYALMNTAKEVGGDFYDFYFTDDRHFAFLIADVSGKGIPAAMFMMASKTLIKGLAERGKTVDEVFVETNEKLCANNDAGMFVTAWMGVVNLETGHVAYANAGHNPPLFGGKNGEFRYIKDKPNFVLAGMEGTPYKKHEAVMAPGDIFYLYTDGVTEATDSNNDLYGEERLLKIIKTANDDSPEKICKKVEKDVSKFVGDAPQSDDVTMLAFRLNYMQSANSICVYPDMESLELVGEFINSKLSLLNVSKSVLNKVQIAVDEIYSNIMNYGEASRVKIGFIFDNDNLALTFTDNGKQYDPTKAEDPDITLSAEKRKIGGLGIFMVKNMANSLNYKYENGENILSVEFDLK